jgi:hypothetical protein
MLTELLRTIKTHPFSSLEELGKELDLPIKLIEGMITELTKMGYLKSFEDCDSTCDHCPVGTACAGNTRSKVWMLTEKGQKTAEKSTVL